jgi:hypothetical protein
LRECAAAERFLSEVEKLLTAENAEKGVSVCALSDVLMSLGNARSLDCVRLAPHFARDDSF